MALARRPGGHHREWLVDARDDGRRMELSWHRRERLVVVSLWQGASCRATFRMPIADAPAAIGMLSAALGEAASGRAPDAATPLGRPKPGRPPRRPTGILERIGRALRLRRTRAEVVELSAYRAE